MRPKTDKVYKWIKGSVSCWVRIVSVLAHNESVDKTLWEWVKGK